MIINNILVDNWLLIRDISFFWISISYNFHPHPFGQMIRYSLKYTLIKWNAEITFIFIARALVQTADNFPNISQDLKNDECVLPGERARCELVTAQLITSISSVDRNTSLKCSRHSEENIRCLITAIMFLSTEVLKGAIRLDQLLSSSPVCIL